MAHQTSFARAEFTAEAPVRQARISLKPNAGTEICAQGTDSSGRAQQGIERDIDTGIQPVDPDGELRIATETGKAGPVKPGKVAG